MCDARRKLLDTHVGITFFVRRRERVWGWWNTDVGAEFNMDLDTLQNKKLLSLRIKI